MTKQASRFVGSIPEHYDRYLGPRIFNGFGQDIAARTAKMAPTSVLELAAGTGIVSRHLRDALPADCSLIATDLNPPMLELAKSKFQAGENVRFEEADATSLPYDDSSFDAVVCQFGVMFFPDRQRSYEEAERVLKPGGRYILNVWGSLEDNPFAQIAHMTVAQFFPDDPPGFYKVPFSYYDDSVISESMAQAGFDQVAVHPLEINSDIPSATDFATGLVYGNPLFEEITTRGGDPEQVHLAVANSIEEKLGDSMPLKAIVIEARKP
jgi:ubiquinone/menaquinone biosynthesis C-methylase UbiE